MSAKTKISPAPYYVAVGQSAAGVSDSLSYSSDGITWASSTLPVGTNGLGRVVFGEDKFVAITSYTNNQAAYSTDGINWTATTLPSSGNWNSLSYGGGKFVAIRSSSNAAAYSTDGITWTATTLPSSASWLSVTYGDGKFVAIARYSSTNAYSTDGITWNAGTMPSGASWQAVAYGEGKFVALINDSTNFAYSSNGSTWTLGSMPYSYKEWSSIAYGDGKFVALINNSSDSAYSLDGVSWTASTMPSSRYWSAITYANEKFVALAYQSTTTAYSTDGITWSTSNITAAAGWGSIAYGNGIWREMTAPYIKVSGVWKMAKAAYTKISGSWKNWFLQGGIVDVPFSNNLVSSGFLSTSGDITDVGIQSDGKIVICGFWDIASLGIENFGRLNRDGTIDTSFLGNYWNGDKIAILPDDKIVLIGPFNLGIRKFSSNGEEDASFTSNIGTGFYPDNGLLDIKLQADNKIIISGNFTDFNGTPVKNLVRLNSDGTLDTAFETNLGTGPSRTGSTNVNIDVVAVQSDGKILIGGYFTGFNGTSANRIARLNSDGTLDSTFMTNIGSGFSSNVASFSIQQDQKIIVGGGFSSFNGTSVDRLVRLNSDGTLDTSFDVTGGIFYTEPNSLILPNGEIFVYGFSSDYYNSLLVTGVNRFSSTGTMDTSFVLNAGSGTEYDGSQNVYSAKLQNDGKIIICGRINSFNGITSPYIVRIGGGVASS